MPNYSSLVSIAVAPHARPCLNKGIDQVDNPRGLSPRCGKVACVDTTRQTASKEDVRSRSRDVAALVSPFKREHVKWCMSF